MTSCQNSNRNKFIYYLIYLFKYNKATLELLKSSISVSVSGAFRIYLASLLLNTQVPFLTCLAGGLIIYSVYTLDRALGSEEDIVNRKELNGSRKEIGLAASMLTFVIGSYVLAKGGMLALAFLPLITGFLYSKGIKIGKFKLRLKGGLGVKNIVVGIMWGMFIAGVAGQYCSYSYSIGIVFLLYGVKTFVNSVIDDFKDIKGDTLAGIKTLPVKLGEIKTRNSLLVLHIIAHIILLSALVNGIIAFEPVIIAGSFICGLICILRYINESKYRERKYEMLFFKDGESAITSVLILLFYA